MDCGDGWVGDDVSGNCYYLSSNAVGWDEARVYCQSMASDLMSVSNEQEQDFVYGKGL